MSNSFVPPVQYANAMLSNIQKCTKEFHLFGFVSYKLKKQHIHKWTEIR